MSTVNAGEPPEPAQSTAVRAANDIRTGIIEGRLQPGQRLTEDRIRAELDVSRSTLREAFQLLIRERLLVHRFSRGFFVRRLTRSDLSDLYLSRKLLECGALLRVHTLQPGILRRLALAVSEGRDAAESKDWQRVAAASISCHENLVALAGSDRLNDMIRQVLAEFRLAYSLMDDPLAFHLPFLDRNAAIVDLVGRGNLEAAAAELESYLEDSEAALMRIVPME